MVSGFFLQFLLYILLKEMEYLQQKVPPPPGHFCPSIKAKLLQMKRKLKGVNKDIKEKAVDVSCIFLNA